MIKRRKMKSTSPRARKSGPSQKKQPIAYRIVSVLIVDVHIKNTSGLDQQKIMEVKGKFVYHTSAKMHVRDNQFADVILSYKVTLDPKLLGQKGEPIEVISITPVVTFEMKGVEAHLDSDGQVVLDPQLLMGLMSAAIGTSRGMFWSKLHGTQYEGVMLPLLGHDQLVKITDSYQRVPSNKPKAHRAPAG